jgi:hypothetical protein
VADAPFPVPTLLGQLGEAYRLNTTKESLMEGIPYPNNGRCVLGAEHERYAKIAAQWYASASLPVSL